MRKAIVEDIKETGTTTVKTVKKETAQADKKESVAGRKKVKASQKKKPRQVFYSDESFEDIEKCSEFMSIEPKTFMEMAISKQVKAILKDMEEA